MATVLGGVLSKNSVLLCFSVGERAQYEDNHKEIFPVYGGKCLSRKAVHKSVENSHKDGRK
jgi:uncharacterized protein (DUF1330 family)